MSCFLVLIFVRKFEHCCGTGSTFANWLLSWIGEDRCPWKGVVCSRTSGNVIKLDLRNQFQLDELGIPYFDFYPGNYSSVFLKVDINPSLLDLKHLEYLDLSMNDFSSRSKIP
ncbi:leucine-rich repeat receptor-like protein CLAVATA2 [Populus alba x Populus x berolinensis]|nr:leucine-rich repeat receptor-like protein CLAVATA2 [Populus alba x Populus x berolinensis]